MRPGIAVSGQRRAQDRGAPLNRGTAAGPGAVQELEAEQAFGEALIEDGAGFGGGGHGGGSWPKPHHDSLAAAWRISIITRAKRGRVIRAGFGPVCHPT